MSELNSRFAKVRRDGQMRWLGRNVLLALAVSCALITITSLMLPGFTETRQTYCGLEEHTHTEACGDAEHPCELMEHVHGLSCYANPEADVESPEVWERTMPSFAAGEPRLTRVVEIAKSQLGYAESTANYVVEADGVTTHGYTRYGAWLGDPYADWNAAFALFCLDYAGIGPDLMPSVPDADAWLALVSADPARFHAAQEPGFTPHAADLLFHRSQDGTTRVALVRGVQKDASGVRRVTFVEGATEGAVRQEKLTLDDPSLIGYAAMPQELRDEKAAFKEGATAEEATPEQASVGAAAIEVVDEGAGTDAVTPDEPAPADGEAGIAELPVADEAIVEEVRDQVLVADVEGYRISVDLGAPAGAGETLEVSAVTPTRLQIAAVESCLSEDLGSGVTRRAHVSSHDLVAFDIRVLDATGSEVTLDQAASVTVEQVASPFEGLLVVQEETSMPEVVHLADGSPELLEARPVGDGFSFATQGFSPYVFVYTVDYTLDGITWSMPGASSTWLSTVLERVGAPFALEDVTDVSFTDAALIEIAYDEAERDWLLTSRQPFDSTETLTLTLATGERVPVAVTDEGESVQLLNDNFLTSVEFSESDTTLVGATYSPDPMVVRVGHEYVMKLTFTEDEDDHDRQFAEDGVMRFTLPPDVKLPVLKEGDVSTFDIVLDRKHTLKDNTATYHAPTAEYPGGYIDIRWNAADKKNFKLLNASPRATFSMTYIMTTLSIPDNNVITFSNTVTLNVEEDPSYDATVEKDATLRADDEYVIDYAVTVRADGNAKDVTVSDTMGDALTLRQADSIRITYLDAQGQDVSEAYANDNMSDLTTSDRGFSFKLASLKDGHTAVVTYAADIDYKALGGKNLIKETSKNTVKVTDQGGTILDEASQTLDDKINYLQLSKYVGDFSFLEGQDASNWTGLTLPYEVVYNADQKIDVEGATITDTIWKGAKSTTTYDRNVPFLVLAYAQKGSVHEVTGKFTPAAGDNPIIIQDGWDPDAVTVTDYRARTGDEQADTLSSWSYAIPEKSVHGLDPDIQYTYVVSYQAKVRNEGRESGYVGNQVEEDFAGITRDRPKILPGVGPNPEDITVNKVHLEDDYVKGAGGEADRVYSKWKITFKRKPFSLERVQVEDTLPHTEVEGEVPGRKRTLTDTFVNETEGAHAWSVEGIAAPEQCVPAVSSDSYDVVFWFYKNYLGPENKRNDEGLFGTNAALGRKEDITITFWTLNSSDWIDQTARGKAPTEHWNKVHLVQDAWEANDKEYAIPQPTPTLEKRAVQVGTCKQTIDGAEVEMPVYRYTLTLTGMSEQAFTRDGETGRYRLALTDTFNHALRYLDPTEVQALKDAHEIAAEGAETYADGCLLRTIPVADPADAPVRWRATIKEESGAHTLDISLTFDDLDVLRYGVTDDEGMPLMEGTGPDKHQVKVFGQAYEISYYLALDHTYIRNMAQKLVNQADADHPVTDTVRYFENQATWVSVNESLNVNPTASAVVSYDLNPVRKGVNYDPDTELASYTVVVNPLKLRVTEDGSRYKLEDTYQNMAVDFQTVSIVADPEVDPAHPIEWSYHSNKGTFWVPDKTKVTITYEGWPIGSRGMRVNFNNTASISGFEDETHDEASLKADHEGSASTYRVRIFKFADDNMDVKLPYAVFQLFENDATGTMVPMTYQAAHNRPEDDDPAWSAISLQEAAAAGLTNVDGRIPTPEVHQVGDPIYFVTSNGDGDFAGQKGFAEIMLSQSRDGVSLKMNKQYYLREVLVPPGYLKENIDWRFVIGENDDWEHYVYADDSILQVSNASTERALTVHKVFSDRTRDQEIANKDTGYENYQRDVEFEIVGKDDQGRVIYHKVVHYGDFMPVDTPDDSKQGYTREYLLVLKSLQPGTYTVRELSASVAKPAGVDVTTLVGGTDTKTPRNASNDGYDEELASESAVTADEDGTDAGFTFTVDADHKTAVDATFTNIYTDQKTTSLKVNKVWNAGDKDTFSPLTVEFELLADGVRYEGLTAAEGANERGNLVLTPADKAGDDALSWSHTIEHLPKKNAQEADIVWSIREIRATYHMGDENRDFDASGLYLNEHFKVETDATQGDASSGYRFRPGAEDGEPAEIQFTNTLNALITVNVVKIWDDTGQEGVDHTDDVVFVDLYRTKTPIPADANLVQLAGAAGTEHVIEGFELNADNNWAYENKLLEKYSSDDNALYYYFAIERSVAGYETAYVMTSEGEHDQDITVTNTPLTGDPRGTLTIEKQAQGLPEDLAKTYRFTLWNSGKYLHETGELTTERYEFELQAGRSVTFNNVRLGTYVLTEVKKAAQVGGYDLSAVTVAIDGGTPLDVTSAGLATEVTVGAFAAGQASPVSVVVSNTYTQQQKPPTTDFTFGKLWVIPDREKTDTLPWPDDTKISVTLQRRIKGDAGAGAGDPFEYHYQITAATAGLEITAQDGAPQMSVGTGYDVDHYHHYLFTVQGLERYDNHGNEYEYYVTEDAALKADGSQLAGKRFEPLYGHVDGIGAAVVDDQADAASTGRADYVECVINRLDLTQEVSIPIQKAITGRFDLDHNYPRFTFKLYDALGHALQAGNPPQDVEISNDEHGHASFDITELVHLNDMVWWSDEQVLTKTFTYWLQEEPNPPQVNPYDPTNTSLNPVYNGITNTKVSLKVQFTVRYDWQTGQLSFTREGSTQPTLTMPDIVFTNAYEPGETELTVNKTWADDHDRDGYRREAKFKVSATYTDENNVEHHPTTVWFLKDGAQGKEKDEIDLNEFRITVGTADGATGSATLPKFYEGHPITYTVEEEPSETEVEPGVTLARLYTTSESDVSGVHAATNTHEPETINVGVEKKWVDQDATKRAPVTMRLTATYEDAKGQEVKVTSQGVTPAKYESDWSSYLSKFADVNLGAADDWKKETAWSDLPRHAPGQVGKLVSYTVEELASSIPLGYHQLAEDDDTSHEVKTATTADAGQTAQNVIKNVYEKLDIPLRKVWADDGDRDGLRPSSVTFKLSAKTEDGSILIPYSAFVDDAGDTVLATKEVTAGTGDMWEATGWVGLPKYYHGKEITYTVTEQELTPPDTFDSSGNATYYEASETTIDATNEKTRVVTNTHPIERCEVKLTKTWVDNTNQDGRRPDIATYVRNFVHLYAKEGHDASAQEKEYVIGRSPVDAAHKDTFYLYEKTDTAYAQPYEVDGTKAVAVLSGSHEHGAVGDHYYVTWQNLPVNVKAPTTYTYRVTETDAEGHELTTVNSGGLHHNLSNVTGGSTDYSHYYVTSDMVETVGSAGPAFAIANTYEPGTINVQATKVWVRNGQMLTDEEVHQLGLDTGIQFELVATKDGREVDMTTWSSLSHPYQVENPKTVGSEGTVTWQNLPMHDPAGVQKPLTYTVREVATTIPDGYHSASTATIKADELDYRETGTVRVTNTYEDVQVTATKVWDDANNQDGLRRPVTFKLQKRIGETGDFSDIVDSGAEALAHISVAEATRTIGTLDDLSATWSNLPAWKNNKRVYYRVVEVTGTGHEALADYTTTEGTFANPATPATGAGQPAYTVADDITNAHTPTTKTVTFTKQWYHQFATNTLTPDQYKKTLHLWARVVGTSGEPLEVRNSESTTLTTGEPAWFTTDWKSHTTVTENGDGSFCVTVTDLPLNRPKSAATADAEPLVYFLTEGAVDANDEDKVAIEQLMGYYSVSYPGREEGSDLPDGKAKEGETITNIRKTETLSLEKEVVSDLAADETRPFTFTITTQPHVMMNGFNATYTKDDGSSPVYGEVKFNSEGKATVSLSKGQHLDVLDLPIGITYTVTETQENDFETPENRVGESAYATGTSCDCLLGTEDGPFRASFRNTRKVNDLKIEKTVKSAVQDDLTQSYTFRVTLSDTSISKNYVTKVISQGKQTEEHGSVTFTNGVATITLRHGQTLTIKDLPVTVGYTVEEIFANPTDQAKFTTTWTKAVGTGTNQTTSGSGLVVPAAGGTSPTVADVPTTIAYKNTRKTGSLKLSKEVLSPFASERGASYAFMVRLEMPSPNTINDITGITTNYDDETGANNPTISKNDDGTVTVSAQVRRDKPLEVLGLPLDVTYTVTELKPDDTIFAAPGIAYKGKADDATDDEVADQPHAIGAQGEYDVEATNRRKELPVSICKISAINHETTLAGAEFVMRPVVSFSEQSPVSWQEMHLVSNAGGFLIDDTDTQVFALPPGKYQLEETKAPIGYHKLTQPATFSVTADGVTYSDSIYQYDKSVDTQDSTVKDNRVVVVNVANTTGAELPSTGGAGTAAVYAMGMTLVVVAVLLACRRSSEVW